MNENIIKTKYYDLKETSLNEISKKFQNGETFKGILYGNNVKEEIIESGNRNYGKMIKTNSLKDFADKVRKYKLSLILYGNELEDNLKCYEIVKEKGKPIDKIYICGKMTGLDNYNRDKFNEIAKQLRDEGYFVENPAEIIENENWEWEDYMKESISKMLKCDAVLVLGGYETSKGANIEIELAKKLKIEIILEKKEMLKKNKMAY